jgi:hypothetical protein
MSAAIRIQERAATGTVPGTESVGRFYVWTAIAFVLISLVAFAPSYFIPVAAGRFDGPPILHLHGILFFAWPVFFLVQASLAASARLDLHRTVGLIGIALSTAMIFAGSAALSSALNTWIRQGTEAQGRATTVVAFSGLVMFGVFVVAAIKNVRRPDYHKRYMLLATLAMMQGASGRIAFYLGIGHTIPFSRPGMFMPAAPQLVILPHILFDVLILGMACAHDWRTRDRPHRVYVISGTCLLLVQALRHLLVDTVLWRNVTDLLIALGR